MDCDSAKEKMMDWLANQMSEADQVNWDQHLAGCSECQEELRSLRQVWQTMGRVVPPEPGEQMRPRFYAMLEDYKEVVNPVADHSPGWMEKLRSRWIPANLFGIAYTLLLLMVGIGTGYWLKSADSQRPDYQSQMSVLSTEVREMKEMMLLTLIENPAATERLKAVSMTKGIYQVNDRVIDALLSTLNHDENVNVRLVTLDALVQLSDQPKVREGLVQSITRQESPLVQAALVDVMVALQEKRSVSSLRQLLKQQKVDQSIKGKIEKSLKVLI
jgi:predicted RNA binding protein with dsRBD fold (UPF0201 family)